ncbi:hypothetical protein M419DRAFT_121677 [Trichoderma reesei RUT C-30]|uniref:Uncharacterized protein n=1 Tax=Hypocrea jecorina (strain ATCC 56765 / BCRC 32924 / NRRL 11460 / Rut C-30) TaxID=1344414 RepID=A0A024SL86_HYPJR|nr:hypothetical protein M419DRAFT_121677 [Trichoderma reesei RUT C-30]
METTFDETQNTLMRRLYLFFCYAFIRSFLWEQGSSFRAANSFFGLFHMSMDGI